MVTLLTLLVIIASGITTIPLSIAILVVCTVIFRKPWVFFAAFLLGLLLDLYSLRPLGYTSLIFAVLVFIIWLYERKFETQTLAFVFLSTFLGSLVYLWSFGYKMVFLQSFITALLSVLLFRLCHPELVSGSQLRKTEMLK